MDRAVSFRGTERFQLVRLIGHGGMGVVYEAFDQVDATPVALKLLPLVSPDLLLRFKREFRTVSDVRHRNLVRLGELVAHDAQWFFTMELVQGIDFLSYVRGEDAPSAPTPVARLGAAAETLPAAARARAAPIATPIRAERLRPALAQLAEGLSALHAAGCVHRDVKPSNALVTIDGRVVLLDFGLASTAAEETTLVGAGTPAYMAPEQAALTAVTPAADWYAFGVIMFQLLARRLPFEGLPHEILYRKQHEQPPRAADAAPDAPPELAALCDRLLDPDPARRPAAAEVLRLLASAGAAAAPARATAAEPHAQLIGRERELGVLAAALESVRAGGDPTAILVRGESGVGKSALVEAFVKSSDVGGCLLLTARCYERELVPYKAVDGLVDAITRVLRHLDPEALRDVLPARAETLLQAFPVLGRVDAVAQVRRTDIDRDPAEVRASMFGAFRELLIGLARRAPILAVIDDLQWADGDSLALLADALAGPDGPRLLLLGTQRTVAKNRAAGERLFPAKVLEQDLRLENLPDGAARVLARHLLAAGGNRDLDGDAALVARESGGHPLFLRELARTAHLRTGSDRPMTLEDVLGAQIDVLPAHAVRVLRALAIAAAPLRRAVARKATGLDGPAMVAALDDLRAARLIHSGGDADLGDDLVDIVHDRIRQVLRRTTAAGDAAALHASLAEAFEAGDDPLRAGEHWRDAGRPDRAATHFAAAARRAAELLAFDRAAVGFRMAMSLGAWSTEERRELLIGLADAMSNAGRGAAAAPHYLEAADGAAAAKALDLRRRATEELLRSGHVDEGRAVATRALADAGLRFPRSPVATLLWLRAVLRLRGLRFRRRQTDELAPNELARIDLCWSLSSGLALTEPVQGAHFQVRSLLLALRAGETARIARGVAGEAGYAAALGAHRAADRHLRAAADLARDLADPHTTGIVSLMRGLSAHLGGRFASAVEDLDAAERTFRDRCVGTAWELAAARQFSLECLYYLGDLPRFETSAAEGIREAEDRGSVYAATTLRTGLTNGVWLIRNDPARARVEVDEAMARWTSRGYHVQHWYELIARTHIDLYTGDGGAAWERMEKTWPALARSGLLRLQHTRVVASHLRARTAVAAAIVAPDAGARQQLLSAARSCARRIERERGGWALTLAAASHAGAERADGRDDRADALLKEMIARADGEGLLLHAAAARAASGDPEGTRWLRAAGVRDPAALTRMLLPGCERQSKPPLA